DVLQALLDHEHEHIGALARAIQTHNVQHVMIAARGTSDNAGRYAQYLLGALNRLPVALATPSLFSIYNTPPRLQNALVLGISQSGKSPDIVSVVAEARRQGALTAAITNFPDSDLGQEADFVFNLHAGVEQSVAATKTYTSELAAIALLSTALSDDAALSTWLEQAPDLVSQTLALPNDIARAAERYRYMEQCVIIGRGYNYATAFELALKLKELTYTMVEPYSSADFMHGPLALIEHGFPVIVIAPSGVMLPEIKEFMSTLRGRDAELLVISDDAEALELARVPLLLPTAVPEWLSPLLSIVPGQLLAMHL
ncbi:MAG: SIS domain-containing protein, partial [Anaerolineales bacterium]|nr:SIS domain-containing protein [Anaerolineales bacterium]